MNKLFSTGSKFALGLILATAAVSCNQNKSAGTSTKASDSTASNSAKEEKIVYVNSDSLSEKYEYFKDIRTKMESKVKKEEASFQSKGQAFQREVADYQQKAATLSASERQATEERLARKQQELGQIQQNASAAIQQEESKEFNAVYTAVTDYLKKHAEENGYSLVLTYSKSNPTVLYADSKMEITNEVVAGLNKEYSAKKATEKK